MILMKIGKDVIKGESDVVGHVGWINVDSMSFGAGRSAQNNSNDRGVGVAGLSEFSISRTMDCASTELYFQAVAGSSLGDVEIHVLQSGEGEDPRVTNKYILSDVMISSFQTSSSGDKPNEAISLNYTKLGHEIFKWDGGKSTSSGMSTYDLNSGKSA